jgi:YggT family protein
MVPLLQFIDSLIYLYTLVILANIVFSWLIGFNVVNAHHPVVSMIYQAVNALTEPLLKPIRRVLPDLGGLDLSAFVLLLCCYFVQFVVINGWMIPFFR